MHILCDSDRVLPSYFREAVEDCNTNSDLCGLTIKGSGGNARPEQFEATQFGLEKTAAVVAAPLIPDRAAKILIVRSTSLRGLNDQVIAPPRIAGAANRNDWDGSALCIAA